MYFKESVSVSKIIDGHGVVGIIDVVSDLKASEDAKDEIGWWKRPVHHDTSGGGIEGHHIHWSHPRNYRYDVHQSNHTTARVKAGGLTILTGPLTSTDWWTSVNSDSIHRDIIDGIVVQVLQLSHQGVPIYRRVLNITGVGNEVINLVSDKNSIDIYFIWSLPRHIEAVGTAVLNLQIAWSSAGNYNKNMSDGIMVIFPQLTVLGSGLVYWLTVWSIPHSGVGFDSNEVFHILMELSELDHCRAGVYSHSLSCVDIKG